MIANLMDILFGCWHSNYSFPITAKAGPRRPAAQLTGTYVACLECGKEFPYDWKQMRVLTSAPKSQRSAGVLVEAPEAFASKHAA